MVFRSPPPLRPGALVAVVAPASPFDRDELCRGLAWLRTRYRLKVSTNIFSRAGYLAGDDAHRTRELRAAMLDPEVGAIISARGGYGAMRILDGLPWAELAARPKWLIGFSDITALHVMANARSICSVHAPNVTALGRPITAMERVALIHAIEGRPARPWTGLEMVHAGSGGPVRGPLLGGNLALLVGMAAAGRLSLPPGAILALEDLNERPYRIDRMVTSLRLGGHLSRLSALVLGSFTQCDPGTDGMTAAAVLRELTEPLGIPVLANAPFGHGAPNQPFVLGSTATIIGSTLEMSAP